MTISELVSADFKEYPDRTGDRFKRALYQKSVRDKVGIRYWLNVQHCVWPNGDESFELKVCFINGVEGWTTPLTISAAVHDKNPADILALADFLWENLKPAYYETFGR